MARSITDSLSLLETSLSDIKTSLANKDVVVSSLKASEVPDKIRQIEFGTTYGVEIISDESDPEKRVVYTKSAVGMSPVTVDQTTGKPNYNGWDKTWIFEKIYPVMLKTDGTIDYKLNPNDYSKREDGSPSDIDNINYDGNAMVCIEKFYTNLDYYYASPGYNEKIEISDTKKSGFSAIGFIREDGTEADRIFLPMFMGSFDSDNKLRSISGQPIKYSTSFNNFRTAAQKNGSGYEIEYYAENQVMQALWLILMKNCDYKAVVGEGRVYSNAKTGVGNALGAISFDPTTKSIKFMHIEDFLTSDMSRVEVGLLFYYDGPYTMYKNVAYVKMRPPYSSTDTSGYSKISYYDNDLDPWLNVVSQMFGSNLYGRFPTRYEDSQSITIYEAAQYDFGEGSRETFVSYRGTKYYGVSGRYIGVNPTNAKATSRGAALTYLPPA